MRVALGLVLLPWIGMSAGLISVATRTGDVATETVEIPQLTPAAAYSLLYSISPLQSLGPQALVEIEVRQGIAVLASKTLHAGDADFYTQFRVPQAGAVAVAVRAKSAGGRYSLTVNQWPASGTVKSGPVAQWQDAMTIPLGETVFASGDDEEYIPLPGTTRKALADRSRRDWYKFEFTSPAPKLVFFQVDLMERDQIPVDVSVYHLAGGKLEEYFEGEDPVTMPHEVQALPGNKFTPRVLKERGTYYVAVHAGHPEYKLRTRVYDAPPYNDPRKAVRTAVDYILAAGDSWHANTPRRGGVYDRVSSVHQETSLCVACHTTHYPLRAQMYALRNGYPIVERQQVQFLTERFYNNPRPFYGFEDTGTVWARVISASANVLGRMSHLLDIFEDQVTREPRPAFHEGVRKYLDLYYAGRDTLPPDETNGNTPLVSAHQVAWYAWEATKDPRMGEFIANGEVKNTIDLCYQTLALAAIDRGKYAERIAKNVARLLALQRPDGQWPARFEPNQPVAEFQTGHALWALHDAGVPVTHPAVAKAIDYLLRRQQTFGGWLDPLQSYENFRTPFRETQMAVLALSAYFPGDKMQPGWHAPAVERISTDPVEALVQFDNVWDQPSDAVRRQIDATAHSADALLRQAAVEALGRLGVFHDTTLLGDPSKMVQRTAAWALRQSYSRHEDTPAAQLTDALASPDDRMRWGATRVFAQHFAAIARRNEMAPALSKLVGDPVVPVRMQAVKGLWQLWFWTPDPATKSAIEDTLLTAMAKPQPVWISSNLRDAVYNLADENIRYLYNNWVALLPRAEDRERAIRGRLAVEARLAAKFANVLSSGPDAEKKELLHALTEFPLRRGDAYDAEADVTKPGPPIYSRIGNDTEQIAFFGQSADKLAAPITPLLDSSDPEMRRLAGRAALLVRDVKYPDVNRIAGPAGEPVKTLMAKIDRVPEAADTVAALKPPPRPARPASDSAAPGTARAQKRLDEGFFRGYVEPILVRRGKDGYACVQCHATHTLFDGTYAGAMRVVDTANPEQSLILRKPTSSSDSEGVVNAATLAHGGGVRFTRDSPEYATILEWIKGAKE
jgi:hypothetical protein